MLLLKNGHLLPMKGKELKSGDILVKDGKIADIGATLDYPNAKSVDLNGAYVMPGMIDAHCHIGMWEDGLDIEGADGNEDTDPVMPHLRAIDAINPQDNAFREARENGVTTAVTGPGSANVLGGQFAAVKTCGRRIDDMIIAAPVAMKAALGENPKKVYREQQKAPVTRMATAAIMREAFAQAQEYRRKQMLGKKDKDKLPDVDLKMEALVPVLEGKLKLKVHAHRADDILTAIRIQKEFGFEMTIEHCTEGHLIADILKAENVSPIIGPLLVERSKVELKNLTFGAPKLLEDAGLKFALMTDHPVIPIQFLPVCAAIAVREGLSEQTALRAMTIHAAEIVGIAKRVGSLEKGKDADIAVFDGHPLDIRSRSVLVLIDGEIVFER